MPVQAKSKPRVKITKHTKQGRTALKRALRKMVTARVLMKHGKVAKANAMRKVARKQMTKAVGHFAHATTIKKRVRANRRRGGGGGGSSSGILSTIGSIAGSILGFL